MSTLLGQPSDRWPLSRAVDAMADSARRAGVPGWIWVAGLFYPSLSINVELVRALLAVLGDVSGVEVPGSADPGELLFLFAPRLPGLDENLRFLILPLFLILYRLIVGLAKISDPKVWDEVQDESRRFSKESGMRRGTVTMAAAWKAGKGLGLVAFGMWLMLLLLLLGALIVLVGPVIGLLTLFHLADYSHLLTGLLLPVLLLLMAYAVVLMVLNQLALHSLAHNRRGVASALTHAWRLMRASPWSAFRATVVDVVLFVSIFAAVNVFVGFARATGFLGWTAPLIVMVLYGFAGVTRAGYWARTYRALGGLSSADHVPGL